MFEFNWFPADQFDLSLAVTPVIFLKMQPNLSTSYIFWFQIVYSILYSSSASIYCISYTKGTLYTLYHNFAINSFSRFIKIYSTDICNIFQFRIPKFEVEFQVGGVTKNPLLNELDQLESAHDNNFVILFTISFDLSSTFWIFSLESAKPEAGQR